MKFSRLVFSLGLAVAVSALPAWAQDELGPLAGVVDQQLLQGWQGGVQDGWYVLRNDSLEGSEQTLMLNAGPAPADGRHVMVNVSLNSRVPQAAIGILTRNKSDLCLMEITADASANLFCIVGGQQQQVAKVAGAAKMDGSDIIEMIELPGVARFILNGQTVGDVEYASALGGEIGIMAYERGTFGLADFLIYDLPPSEASAGGGSGSGLPPRGGGSAEAGSGLPPRGGASSTPAQAPAGGGTSGSGGGGGGDTASRMSTIMGPLGEVIMADDDRNGFEPFFEDNWLVFVNEQTAGSEIYYTTPVGQPPSEGRVTSLRIGIRPPEGQDVASFAKSAGGILVESPDGKNSCVGEITAGGDGLALCFDANGKGTEIARLPGAAVGNGQDVIEFVEQPGSGAFLLNGQLLARVENTAALGGNIGILAYERGQFYMGDFSVLSATSNNSSPAAPPPGSGPAAGGESPLPYFGGDKNKIVGVYLGITNGVFMHEFGHALIGELQLPSTGPEEDAVDIFSALRVVEPTMYPSGDADIDDIGRQVALYSTLPWYYSGLMAEQSGGSSLPWQDEHTADLKRFRNTFCVIYGGNPGLYSEIAEQVGMETRTLGRCEDEFNKQNRAWRTILAPHTRVGQWHPEGQLAADAPGANINVVFEPTQSQVGQLLIQAFKEGIEGFAADLTKTYALPRDLTIIYKDCGELNAWYSPSEASITMCYDLIEYFAVMISDIEAGTQGGVDPTAPRLSTNTAPSASPGTNSEASAAVANVNISTSAVNELEDFGVPATNVLFSAPYRGPTPADHTRATLLTTASLAELFGEGKPFILIDTSGQDQSLPGALAVTDAGKDGSLTDSFQSIVGRWLTDQTGNNTQTPIIFFGTGLQDRSAYNAALRAGTLGWNAYWYRGGIEAWKANGLPLDAQQ